MERDRKHGLNVIEADDGALRGDTEAFFVQIAPGVPGQHVAEGEDGGEGDILPLHLGQNAAAAVGDNGDLLHELRQDRNAHFTVCPQVSGKALRCGRNVHWTVEH